jgi:hypothetical protein
MVDGECKANVKSDFVVITGILLKLLVDWGSHSSDYEDYCLLGWDTK